MSMSSESFKELAEQVGLRVSAEHLEVLRPEVSALLSRIEALDDIDASEVTPEEAGLVQDGDGR